jgi:clan AA aspartic protease
MLGTVTADGGEPRLPVVVLEAAGGASNVVEIDAVVDTGFDGESQLPPVIIGRLGHPYEGSTRGLLADGSEGWFDYHTGNILWHGTEREVVVIASDGDPLVGMALLDGSRLTVDAVPGGIVRIEELSG